MDFFSSLWLDAPRAHLLARAVGLEEALRLDLLPEATQRLQPGYASVVPIGSRQLRTVTQRLPNAAVLRSGEPVSLVRSAR